MRLMLGGYYLARLANKLMPSSGCPLIGAQERWLEPMWKGTVKAIGGSAL